jgi:hypothetical protein
VTKETKDAGSRNASAQSVQAMRVYDLGGGWGDSIGWLGDGLHDGRLVGWKTPRPSVGDRVRVKMTSGRPLLLEIVTVDYKHNPPDMFFATTKPIGYEDGQP